MRKFATLLLLAAGLALASNAFAVDNHVRTASPSFRPHHTLGAFSSNAVLGCDDGFFFNAYFQGQDDRIGNLFDFGASSVLSRASFLHFGFGFPGPYNYNLEVWDPTSCTRVLAKNGLVAQDAANAEAVELIELCSDNIQLSGVKMVGIWPRSCLAANDCYPDIAFDDQIDVVCPVIINNASTAPACFDVSGNSGPFLFRVETNACAVPTQTRSWGQVKNYYR